MLKIISLFYLISTQYKKLSCTINCQLKLPLINIETILSEYIFRNKECNLSNCIFDNNTIIEIKFIFE